MKLFYKIIIYICFMLILAAGSLVINEHTSNTQKQNRVNLCKIYLLSIIAILPTRALILTEKNTNK